MSRRTRQERREQRRRRKWFWILVTLCCVALQALLIAVIVSWYSPYPAFRQKQAIVLSPGIAQGMYIDGVHVGGMTQAEAQRRLMKNDEQISARILLHVDDLTFTLTEKELGLHRNTDELIEFAMAIGRRESASAVDVTSSGSDESACVTVARVGSTPSSKQATGRSYGPPTRQ